MELHAAALAASLVFASTSVVAQDPQMASGQIATIQPVSAGSILRAGTSVALKTREALTTKGKKLKVGQRIQMEVAEPVLLNGAVVIPAGSPAMGEVTDVRNKGMWGKSGRINARVLYATVNGRQVRMSGQFDDKGTTGTAGVVGSLVVIPVAGFFVTGTSANIPLGAPISGFLDEDVPVAFGPAAVTPSQVALPVVAPAAALPVVQPAVMTVAAPAGGK